MPQLRSPRQRWMPIAAVTTLLLSGVIAGTQLASAATTGCQVGYAVSSQWAGGFGANVTVTNLGDLVNTWRLTWTFASGQTITQLWNGTYTQSGSQVSVTNMSYNGTIATGGTTTF